METKVFFILKSSFLSASFEYLCYGSTATRNILIFSARDDNFRRQIMTSNDDPRNEEVNSSFYFGPQSVTV